MADFLIDSKETLMQHVALVSNFDFDKLAKYRKRVDRKYIVSQIGLDQYRVLTSYQDVDEDVLEVKSLFEEAAANYLMFEAIPIINATVTNSGIKTTETSKSKDADWREVRDLRRNYCKTANEAVDLAMELMEKYPDKFLPWKESERFTLFNDLVVRHTSQFNQYQDIQNSRKTFLALKPYMLEVEDQYLLSSFGECTLNFLKENSQEAIVKTAQEYLRKAVVAFTIAKAALTGTFVITDSAFLIATDEFAWEKKQLDLSEEKLKRLRADRENAGINYLKHLKTIIINNPDVFTCFEQNSTTTPSRIMKLKGSIAL